MRLLGALVLLARWSGVASEGTPCPLALSIPVPDGEAESRPDGSLVHSGRVYPAGAHWRDANGSHACVCSAERAGRPCLRQCCGDGRIIAEVVRKPEEQCEPRSGPADSRDELLIPAHRASPEMRTQLAGRPSLRDWFELVESPACPENSQSWHLDPLQHDEAYILYPNGSLWVQAIQDEIELVPNELFCLDRGRSRNQSDELVAIVCIPNQLDIPKTPTAIWIGYLLSVPFLAVTFVVYAIIPELRNIYGKTLMCYVLSLLIAYASFLLSHSLVVPYCGYADIRSPVERNSEICGKNELLSKCAPSCERICDDINNDNHAGERCISSRNCENKCICRDGYVRENINGKCIRMQECPRVKH